MGVLMHAFAGRDLVWYTAICGEHDDHCIALAVDPGKAQQLENAAESDSVRAAALPPELSLDSHPLVESVQVALGVRLDEGGFHDSAMHDVKFKVYVHDDCFFLISTVDPELLSRLIHCILQQHSFYLGREVDWSGVLGQVIKIVKSAPGIELRSNPRVAQLLLKSKRPGVNLWEAMFGRREKQLIDGSATPARFISPAAK
jgi:hypothetical protein